MIGDSLLIEKLLVNGPVGGGGDGVTPKDEVGTCEVPADDGRARDHGRLHLANVGMVQYDGRVCGERIDYVNLKLVGIFRNFREEVLGDGCNHKVHMLDFGLCEQLVQLGVVSRIDVADNHFEVAPLSGKFVQGDLRSAPEADDASAESLQPGLLHFRDAVGIGG